MATNNGNQGAGNNGKKRAVPAIAATIAGTELTLDFSNGQKLAIDARTLSEDIRTQALMHGLKQKLVDAAAISADPATGRPATIDTKYRSVREVYDRLLSGEWNKARGDGSGVSGGYLYRALVRMYEGSKTPEQIKLYLEKRTDAEKAELRKNPKVAGVIDDLKQEDAARRAKDGDEGDGEKRDLLAELDMMDEGGAGGEGEGQPPAPAPETPKRRASDRT